MALMKDIPKSERPHVLLKVIEKSTNDVLRLAVHQIHDDGNWMSSRSKLELERYEEIERFPNYLSAQAARMSYNKRFSLGSKLDVSMKEIVKLPDFLPSLPTEPRRRREVFLACEIEQQEEIMYAMTIASGMPRQRLLQYLFVTEDEVAHVDPMIHVAARAELDLRIARKMIGHALADNSPASMTATLYLTKVFLNWNELGIGSNDAGPKPNLEAAKSLFDNLSVVETHRDKDGNTTQDPTTLKLVKQG